MPDARPHLPQSDPAVRTSWLAGILSLVGGLLTTAVIGVGGYLYIVTRLPAMILLVMVVEAALTGLTLAWLYRRTKVRGVTVSILIAAVCGILGGLYCHYGFYVREALNFHDLKLAVDKENMRKMLPLVVKPGTKDYDEALANLENTPSKGGGDPVEEFDRLRVFPVTRHHRFYGYLVQLGVFGITLMMFHVGLVMFLAVQLGWAEPRLKVKAPRVSPDSPL